MSDPDIIENLMFHSPGIPEWLDSMNEPHTGASGNIMMIIMAFPPSVEVSHLVKRLCLKDLHLSHHLAVSYVFTNNAFGEGYE